MKQYFFLILRWQEANSTELVWQARTLGFQLSCSPEEYKKGYYWLTVVDWDLLLE